MNGHAAVNDLCMYVCRVIEAILITVVTTASVFTVATFLGTCVRENTLTDTSDCPGFVRLNTICMSLCSQLSP